MSDEERTEDLNPRSDDIEEKVKRMLDPSIPDEPESTVQRAKKPKPSSKEEVDEIQSVPTPAAEGTQDVPLSAPELPKTSQQTDASKSKKVIIPISHHDEETAKEPAPEPEGSDSAAGDAPLEKPAEEVPEAETAPPVKQITIVEHGESTAGVAEELDAAIAGLGPEGPEAASPPEADSEEPGPGETEDIEPVEPAEADIPVVDPAVIADPATDKAVEEIVAAEGDELLEVEDAVRDTDEPVKPVKKPRRNFLQTLKAWWAKPAFRFTAITLVLLSLLAAAVVPNSRYFILNTAGVRASSSLLILDNSTQQPLKNAKVKIGNSNGITDEEGKVSLQKVKLGTSVLSIEKTAFAPVTKTIVVGWGSNPLGDFKLTPTGSQYSFTVVDFLSGKPLSKAEAASGDASAVSDDKGVIKLTIDKPDEQQFEVSIHADGYRTEKLSIDPNDKTTHSVKLVPARKQVFVSKRSGKYDIYSVYIDGKDEKLVLAGSGNEKEGMVLVPHPNDEVVAYVSTRAGQLNSDKFLLSNLIIINTADNTTSSVIASERVQIVDWMDDHLVYVQIAAGSSANSPKRYRLMSYNYKDDTNKELASSNFFNDVIAANGAIYYAPSSAYQTGTPGFYKVNPDGSALQTIFNQEVWNIFRTAFDHFALSVQQQWYDYRLGDKAPTKLNSAPANQASRVYVTSPDGKQGAWVDSRDGKGVLLSYDMASKNDATLQSQSGLGYPVRWLNNKAIVYRVKTGQETADYAISIDGGGPVKIKDVTNSGGLNRWYYY